MQRTLCSGMPVTKAVSRSRWMCGVWLDIQTVYSSVPGLYQPMSPRTSIGFGISRWLMRRCLTTTSASANACSVPDLSPTVQVKTSLFGAFSWSCGAPGWVAFSASTTAGSGSQSTWISSSASSACAGVSAQTPGTPSRGRPRAARGSALAGPLHGLLREDVGRADVVLDPRGAASRPRHRQRVVRDVRAGDHREHAGGGRGRAGVDRADVRVRVRAPEDGDADHPGELDVIEVAPLAGDELRVFDPLDRGTEDVCDHVSAPQAVAAGVGPSRMMRAASRIARTMLW